MKTEVIWAKSGNPQGDGFHPLLLHLLDVACCANAILDREPVTTHARLAGVLGLPWQSARPWILLVIAAHDIGKACVPFQRKWPEGIQALQAAGLRCPPCLTPNINHGWVSQLFLRQALESLGWPKELAFLAADAVGCHHGERAGEGRLPRGRDIWQVPGWDEARKSIFKSLYEFFDPRELPTPERMEGSDFMLLAGLTSFADWIGSSEEHFPFGSPIDCEDLSAWWSQRKQAAEAALDQLGWEERIPAFASDLSFEDVFPFPPRPLQKAVAQAAHAVSGPAVLLIEAPMGEGKTEAAFYAHGQLQRRFGHRGLYIALPTKATGNAMFVRTLEFLAKQMPGRRVDLQLLHGATALNDTFQALRYGSIHDSETGGNVRAAEWFTHRKRALLSEYGVGTVDQALITILPVRHQFVRLWGLANRVVVFDEIHAYDIYTGTLLLNLIQWLVALGSSIVLLSATLPPSLRRKLAGILGTELPVKEAAYPRLSVFQQGSVSQSSFTADPKRRRMLQVLGVSPELPCVLAAVEQHLLDRGSVLVLLNTVQRAQDLYRLYPEGEPILVDSTQVGKRLSDGLEVYLFHARFPADLRQVREDHALKFFGKKADRMCRRILIATQVAEQSLDLDFDLMVTDLAPIDLVLQRAGRLWRHDREDRPVQRPILLVTSLDTVAPPSFGAPLWWGAVYQEDILLRTWALLRERESLTLPDDIDPLVSRVYEEEVALPAILQDRHDKAMEEATGKAYAERLKALLATIGSPLDGSWNDPNRLEKADEDEPGLYPALRALTRLGDESITVIPILPEDDYSSEVIPSHTQARQWSLRSMNLTRKQVVKPLQVGGIPKGWQDSALLRHAYPLLLDDGRRWLVDPKVRLDQAIGLVFETEEAH